MNQLQVGDRVNRIEKREVTGATVLSVRGGNVEIAYDEGDSGWWPVDCLEKIES